ncbi:hypothetical protein PR202_ga21954 [Eleusine coracana subsp. coracana]|uniref:Uncharacterized protein n=1 Tax=Eleusine coracana subsp. coracana TaxID=191504 RepID=A0AAV5D297_ELECO|nr:hypothetical protein PR202_ga21954 [Eleusine coracana subsp. coracana]
MTTAACDSPRAGEVVWALSEERSHCVDHPRAGSVPPWRLDLAGGAQSSVAAADPFSLLHPRLPTLLRVKADDFKDPIECAERLASFSLTWSAVASREVRMCNCLPLGVSQSCVVCLSQIWCPVPAMSSGRMVKETAEDMAVVVDVSNTPLQTSIKTIFRSEMLIIFSKDGLPSVVTSDGDHINLFSSGSDFAALALLGGGRGAAREREPEANPKPNPKMRKEEVREERTKSTKGRQGRRYWRRRRRRRGMRTRLRLHVVLISCSLFFLAGLFGSLLFTQDPQPTEEVDLSAWREQLLEEAWPEMAYDESGESAPSLFRGLRWPTAHHFTVLVITCKLK